MRVAIFLCAILAFVLAAAALPTSAPAEAVAPAASRPHLVPSAHGLKATVASLEKALRRRGVQTVVKLDRPGAGGAATLVMFADPAREALNSGYALDEMEPRLRALVFTDAGGVKIAFDDAKVVARRAGLSLDDATLASRILAEAAAEAAAS